MPVEPLIQLAELIRERNLNARAITSVIGRPALLGHLGEFIAAAIFEIELESLAIAKGIDGRFRTGPLSGKTVNIKWYAMQEGLLDIRPDALPDFFLVLAGPRGQAVSSRDECRVWSIDSVFLFSALKLVDGLAQRTVKIGVATSVIATLWREAEVFPASSNAYLALTPHQRELLAMFSSTAVGA